MKKRIEEESKGRQMTKAKMNGGTSPHRHRSLYRVQCAASMIGPGRLLHIETIHTFMMIVICNFSGPIKCRGRSKLIKAAEIFQCGVIQEASWRFWAELPIDAVQLFRISLS